MGPTLVFCHSPFQKELSEIHAYCKSRRYDGVEWSLDGWRLMLARERRRQMLDRLRAASPVCSLHAPYTDLELGHRDPEHAAAALRILQDYVDAAADLGAHHVNVHVGTFAPDPAELSRESILRNISALLAHGERRRVPVTVENLRGGPTSDPDSFAAILRATGAPVTFDLGHAAGCAWVQDGRGSVVDFLRSVPTRILAGHVYLMEQDDTHFPPKTTAEIAPALAALTAAGCDFWVLELHSLDSLEQTRRIVDQHLSGRTPARRTGQTALP
jgi:sugar phosphate isomerase/epimerase